MKLSLFLLITTIICLYYCQIAAPTKSTTIRIPNTTNQKMSVKSSEKENKTISSIDKEEKVENFAGDTEFIEVEEDVEAYLDFVRKQMQESIREHLQNIQEKLGEEYNEKAEKLILM